MVDEVLGEAGEQLVEFLYWLPETGRQDDLATQVTTYQTEVSKFLPCGGLAADSTGLWTHVRRS